MTWVDVELPSVDRGSCDEVEQRRLSHPLGEQADELVRSGMSDTSSSAIISAASGDERLHDVADDELQGRYPPSLVVTSANRPPPRRRQELGFFSRHEAHGATWDADEEGDGMMARRALTVLLLMITLASRLSLT
jgi:hypothetical protein